MKKTNASLISHLVMLFMLWPSGNYSTVFSQSWTSADGGGTAGINTTTAAYSRVPSTVVYNGFLYSAWQEQNTGIDEVHIKKYDGSSWTVAGESGSSKLNSSSVNARNPKIVYYNGALYAAYEEYDAGICRIHVKKYNGTSWSLVQSYSPGDGRTTIDIGTTSEGAQVDLMVYNGYLYAAWAEVPSAGTYNIRVSRFDGSLWSNVDGGGTYGLNYNTSNEAHTPRFAVYNNQLYLTWVEVGGSASVNQVRIKRFDGGGVWSFVDGGLTNGLNYDPLKRALTPVMTSFNNMLYLVWIEPHETINGDVDILRVRKYNGMDWTFADGGTSSSGWNMNVLNPASNPECIGINDLLYVAWNEAEDAGINQVRAATYDGTTKTFLDGGGMTSNINYLSTKNAREPVLSNYLGNLYLTWQEDNGGDQIRVKKYLLLPIIESVSVPANATYSAGQFMDFTVIFSKVVNVSGGNPYIPITLNTGGTVNATYVSGSGTRSLLFRYTVVSGNDDNDGITVGSSMILPGGCTLRSSDTSPLDANLTLNSVNSTTGVRVDAKVPTITASNITLNNNYIDITFSEGIYGAPDGITALTASKFSITFTKNSGGNATGAVISSIRKNDNTLEGSASALTGGETTVRVFLIVTGTPSGLETVEIRPANATSVFDWAGNAMSFSQTTGSLTLNDKLVPTVTSINRLTPAGSQTNAATVVYRVTFSESVTGVDAGDFSLNLSGVSGNIASVSSSTGTTVDVTVNTITGNGTLRLDLNNSGTGIFDQVNNPVSGGFYSGQLYTIDNVDPMVSSVDVPSNATYVAGQNLDFTVNYNEAVVVTGTPYIPITLATGGTVNASYQSGSGTTALVFRYTVATGNYDNDGVSVGSAIALNSGTIKDAAGNNAALTLAGVGSTTGVLVDAVPPAVVISSTAANSTKNSPIPVTITFSEPVTGFDISDISIGNGTKDNFNGGGTTYTLDITPSAQGTITVNIADGAATDAAGNVNSAAIQFSRTYDTQSPSVAIGSTTSNTTNASPIPVTITFSEPVTGFDASNITVVNGAKGILSGSGAIYTIDITPSAQGAVTVNISDGAAIDGAGNISSSATQFSRIYDNQAPGVSVTSPIFDPTNLSKLPVNIVFSEEVTGFTLSDVSVYNGTASDLQTTDNIHWTVNVSPKNSSMFTITVQAGAAQDLAGNDNTQSPWFQRTYDPNPPTVTLSSTSPNPTRDKPMVVNIKFSETVVNFNVNDVKVVNGTASNLQADYYRENWTVDIYPSADGLVTVDIPAGAAQDYATNNNTAAVQFSRTCDITPPTVVISSTSTTSTNSNPIPVTITFSEPVSGFDAGDITVVNGSKGALTGSGSTYTIDITPSAQGPVTVDIGANVAQDALGNGNIAAAQFSRTFDHVAPFVSSFDRQTPASGLTNASSVVYRITFNENVKGLDVSDFSLTSTGTATGTIASVSSASGTIIDVTVNSVSGNGTLRLDLKNSGTGITDDAGNYISSGYTSGQAYTIDKTAPSVTISSATNPSTNVSPIPVTFTFSEPVTGFDASDITVVNGTKGTLSGSGAIYTIDITPSAQGIVTVNLADGAAADAAGNISSSPTQFSRTYDNQAPGVSITSSVQDPTNVITIPVTIEFSESVTGFDAGDITVVNGSKGAITGSGSTYTIDITPSAQGPVTVDIGANVAQDAVGNGNIAAAQFSRTFDNLAPSVLSCDRQTPAEGLTNASSVVYRITFNENVKGLDVSDFSLTSTGTATGTIASVSSASGTIIDVTVNSVSGNGTLRLDLKNSGTGITDDAGNYISSGYTSGQAYTIDKTTPSVTISSTTNPFTNVSPIPVTFTFSEPVTGFDASDITVVNGTKGTLSGSGAIYTIDITPSAQGAVTVYVADGAAVDGAGNISSSATQFSRIYDNQAPGVSVTSPIFDPTNLSQLPVNIVFSEEVTGFTLSDVSVYNGTASDLQTTDNIHWTVNVSPKNSSMFTITVQAGAAQDLAGNDNTQSPWFQRTYDPNPPTVTLSSTSPNPTRDKPMVVNIKFSETVVNFNVNDVKVVNGTASNLQSDYYQENWTVDIYPTATGEVTVDIPAGAAQDQAENDNIAAVQFSRTCDITPPTVVISSTSTTSTNSNPIPVTITFSEPVSGFDAGDITVVNGSKGALTGSGSTYTIDITPSAQGPVTVNIGANVAQDALGNGNIAAAQFSRTFDNLAPSVSSCDRQTPAAGLTNASSVVYRITFNENVKDLDVSDFSLVSTGTATGTIASVSSASGTIIDVTVNSVSGNGTLRLDLKNSGTGITDDAGNDISTGYTSGQAYTIDKTTPSVTISSTTNPFTNVSPIPVTFTFSEPVTGFDADDITVTNGTKGTFSGSGDTYTMNITPTAPGVITVNVGGSIASDAAGNTNSAATTFSITYATEYLISGNAGMAGVTLRYTDGSQKTVVADNDGDYIITVPAGWNGSITPEQAGYTFVPASKSYTNVLSNQTSQDYTATAVTYTISGNTGVGGATLSYTDGSVKTATSDASGNYSFTVSWNWSGTVSVSKAGYTFPANKAYTNVLSNQTSQDYTATAITYTISGNTGVGGATLSYTDGSAKTVTSDASGNYSLTVSWNWSGTVSVSKAGYTFSADKVYSNILSDQSSQNYTATPVTGINEISQSQTTIYPTVNSGKFRLLANMPETGKLLVRVISTQSMAVEQYQFTKTSLSATFEITMRNPVVGFYLVEITMDSYKQVKRIIVE